MAAHENPSRYDLEEARYLIAKKKDALDPDVEARSSASGELLRALVSLSGVTGVNIVEEKFGRGVWVHCGDQSVLVDVDARGTLLASFGGEPAHAVPVPGLEFNPIEERWEGTEPDTFRPSRPGEPYKRRSAVAVVLEYTMNLQPVAGPGSHRGRDR